MTTPAASNTMVRLPNHPAVNSSALIHDVLHSLGQGAQLLGVDAMQDRP